MWFATLFGIGYIPFCPGTTACIAALFIFIFIRSMFWFSIISLVSVVLAFLSCGKAEDIIGKKDAKQIVIDDFGGMLITYSFVPYDIRFVVVGFFLFRMFDMLKIPPADRVEKYKGSLGIVGDDMVAGIYANFLLQGARLLLHL